MATKELRVVGKCVCHMCHGWGVIVMGKNVIGVHEGRFLTVNMDRYIDITGGRFSMLHQLPDFFVHSVHLASGWICWMEWC